MSIEVKRATGIMGGTMGVNLKVNDKSVKTINNNESYTIEADGEFVKVSANQSFLGSMTRDVSQNSTVAIKINGIAVFLIFLSLLVVVIGKNININFVYIGFLGMVFAMIYSMKNWFKIEVDEQNTL